MLADNNKNLARIDEFCGKLKYKRGERKNEEDEGNDGIFDCIVKPENEELIPVSLIDKLPLQLTSSNTLLIDVTFLNLCRILRAQFFFLIENSRINEISIGF